MVAGVFAFIPIDNATSVHTTIMENTQRIDEITAATVTAGDDLTITCPATSDGCRILEIYWRDTDDPSAESVELGAVTATINTVAAIVVADLGTNVNNSFQAIAGVSGITFGGGDILVIATEDPATDSDAYNVVVFIQTEGNTAATASFG